MARPLKTGLDYFPLDVQFDDEVNLIIADFGIEGLGVLISMFQNIYGNKGYYAKWTIREMKLFSRKVGLEFDLSTQIITECIDWGIFNKEKFEKHSILTSRRIQEHYASSTYKRSGVSMLEEYLMIDISDKKHIKNLVSDIGNLDVSEVSDDSSTQSKVQYSTVQESTVQDNNISPDSEESEPEVVAEVEVFKFADKEDSVEYKLADFLRRWILKNNPSAKVPEVATKKFDKWCIDFDRIIRIDAREPVEIKNIIEWCQKDQFWMMNVLSPSKLRKQYDRLSMQKNSMSNNGKDRVTAQIDRMKDW